MKIKSILFATLAFLTLISCNQDKIDELGAKNKVLDEGNAKKDSTINEMLASFNQIQANLSEIKSREGIIKIASQDDLPSEDIGQNITNDIEIISDLMHQNEELIGTLNKQLKNSKVKMSEFRKLISSLNGRVDSKNREIAELNEILKEKQILIGQLYYQNDSLSYMNKLKEEVIKQKIDKLNEGFYAYGSYKELKEQNVLTKEGGFLGIGKNEELKDDFNKDYFSRVDIRKQTSFLIYADKAELITTHPKSSYQFMGTDEKVDSLVITNIDEFWNASRYLVIVVD